MARASRFLTAEITDVNKKDALVEYHLRDKKNWHNSIEKIWK
jgi:hypothetical protein